MGIVLGALAGAGGQLADFADKQMAQDQALQRMNTESDLALQRTQALEQFKADLATSQRQQMVQRVDTAAGQIADQQLAPKIAQEQAGITDPASWTPDQQAAVDQSNAMDRQSIVTQAKADGSAGLASGDIAPEKAMENTSRMQINQIKLDNLLARADDRNQTMQQVAQIRADAVTAAAQLRVDAANQRALNGKIDTATRRMLITSLDTDIKAATSQLNMLGRQLTDTPQQMGGKPNQAYADIQSQISDLREDIASSKRQKAAFFSDAGITPNPAGPKPGTPVDPGAAAPYPEGTKLTGPGGAPYIVKGGVPVPLSQ